MKNLVAVLMLVAVGVVVVACNPASQSEIPSPYKAQILGLRKQTQDLVRQCQDLEKKQHDLQSQMQWNRERMESIAGEALTANGMSARDYSVNLDAMKFERKSK